MQQWAGPAMHMYDITRNVCVLGVQTWTPAEFTSLENLCAQL